MAFNYTMLANYLLCVLFGFLILFIPQRSYLSSWIKVKLGFFKGDVQVRVKNPVNDFFTAGIYSNGNLYYTAKPRRDNKDPKRILNVPLDIYNKAVYRSNGVPCIDVDDVKNCILFWNGEHYDAVEGFNSEAMDKTIETALSQPDPNGNGLMNPKMFQILVILGIIVIGVFSYFILKNVKLVDSHVRLVYDTVLPVVNSMNVTITPTTI